MDTTLGPLNCACVIHGDAYSWTYVDRLYNMLCRHAGREVILHVYTEQHRTVPEPYVKHALIDWAIAGPKKSWWYKMQLFDQQHHSGPLLYFDLDTVIVQNIDWIWKQPPVYFWAVRDFKHLWRPAHVGINSSVMWWNTQTYHHVWEQFVQQDLQKIMKKYHGDQDFINDAIPQEQRRFFDPARIHSWRWQCLDGGYDFRKRRHQNPGQGAKLTENASILIFHGNPKPATVDDKIVLDHWR